MKISEAIKRLTSIMKNNGDIEMQVFIPRKKNTVDSLTHMTLMENETTKENTLLVYRGYEL